MVMLLIRLLSHIRFQPRLALLANTLDAARVDLMYFFAV
jgi:hypothetical protein